MSRARDMANLGDGIDATQITSGVFANERIQASNVTQHEGSIDALASNPTIQLGTNTTFPQGHVLQTQYRTHTGSSISYSTNAYTRVADSANNLYWYGAVTPASGNKVLINFNFIAFMAQGDADDGAAFAIYRESTNIHKHNGKYSFYFGGVTSNHNSYRSVHMCFLDESPGGDGSTEIKYYLGYACYFNSSVQINSADQPFVSVLQEIKG